MTKNEFETRVDQQALGKALPLFAKVMWHNDSLGVVQYEDGREVWLSRVLEGFEMAGVQVLKKFDIQKSLERAEAEFFSDGGNVEASPLEKKYFG